MEGTVDGGKLVVFYSKVNTPGKMDATGAFIPEAIRFRQTHNVPDDNAYGMDLERTSEAKRRKTVLEILSKYKGKQLEGVAFFGHGWPRGIQFGFRYSHIPELSAALSECFADHGKVILYACLTAENEVRDKSIGDLGPATDGGFADLLRDQLVNDGIKNGWVDGHKTAGHTSWNPYCVRFRCDALPKGAENPPMSENGFSLENPYDPYDARGGSWLVEPGSEFWRTWVKCLKDTKTGLRYRFPFMGELAIKKELSDARVRV